MVLSRLGQVIYHGQPAQASAFFLLAGYRLPAPRGNSTANTAEALLDIAAQADGRALGDLAEAWRESEGQAALLQGIEAARDDVGKQARQAGQAAKGGATGEESGHGKPKRHCLSQFKHLTARYSAMSRAAGGAPPTRPSSPSTTSFTTALLLSSDSNPPQTNKHYFTA